MKITKISQQVKRKDRYSVYVDEKYSFSLSDYQLVSAGLRIGKEYTQAELTELINNSEFGKASTVLYMIERVLERLEQKGYSDDQKFAEAWVRSRQLTKKSSKRKLQQELQVKGVNSEIITAVLTDDSIDETENLKKMIEKKQKQARYQDTTKLTQYLLRQGFTYSDIKTALDTTTD